MDKLIITGGTPLKGEVKISGAKNSALGIIPATILIQGKSKLKNVPNISDVLKYIEILEDLGAKVKWEDKNTVIINTEDMHNTVATSEKISKFRASYYLLGAFLSRFNKASVGLPGGCSIGERPIDQHLKGFKLLGADINNSDFVDIKTNNLVGNKVTLDVVSVGATINIMLAATGAKGITRIENAAKEPHVIDIANFLIKAGADIKGVGTDCIEINGPTYFKKEIEYSIVPDQIEAGTFMIAGAFNDGDILISNCVPEDLKIISDILIKIGAEVEEGTDFVRVKASKKLKPIDIITEPYPGFPTDMQAQLAILLCLAKGEGSIHETIWESRFAYVDELKKMGADITVIDNIAHFKGINNLRGSKIYATDLRAGAALLIAGIFAKGTTELCNVFHIDRGYENIENKFRKIGAKIERVSREEDLNV